MVENLSRSRTRRLQFLALAAAVSLIHLRATELIAGRLGSDESVHLIKRIDVAFVRELLPTAAPPVVKPLPARQTARRRAEVATPPASAPEQSEPSMPEQTAARSTEPMRERADEPGAALEVDQPAAPAPALKPAEGAVEAVAEAAAAASASASAAATGLMPPPVDSIEPGLAGAAAPAANAAASAAGALAVYFEWPPSTRLTYRLNGNYRGELEGSATVEWIRVGLSYQVHMEALVGPPFAPLMARRVSSQGVLTEHGLSPRQFDAEQRIGFSRRGWSIRFDPDRIVLADSSVVQSAVGAQDEASQFVQLTWLFTTQPRQLQAGGSVEFPLALPRHVERWVYDVVGEQTLQLPFGPVSTMHLKPRRPGRPGNLTAQMWIAPTLQYLPVRILIHQDEQNFVDLILAKPPLQALQR